jgi:hypothetical protein
MDIESYILDNIDSIIESFQETGDNYEYKLDVEEILDEEKELEDEEDINEQNDIIDEEYYLQLTNVFMLYYNDKYCCNLSIYSSVDEDNKTNRQMEILYYHKTKLEDYRDFMGYEVYSDAMKDIYVKSDYKKLNNVYDEVYLLKTSNGDYYAPCLIIILNYIIKQQIKSGEWKIIDLN